MNIVMTVPSLAANTGGPARTSTSLCTALAREGLGVDLLSLDFASTPDSPILPDSELVRTRMIPCQHGWRFRIIAVPAFRRCLIDLLRHKKHDLIHDNGVWLPSNHAVAGVARHSKLPLVITPRGMLEPWSLRTKAWKKKLAWHLYQHRDLCRARLLHATSEMEADHLRKLGLRQPIVILSNGVEVPANFANLRLFERGRIALFISRIHPKKGLLNLIAAWDKLRPEHWRLIIAGPDEAGHRKEVQAAVTRAKLERDVTLLDAVDGDAKSKLYQAADLFLLPSYSENFGVVVAEALSYGVPVIATKTTPWSELESRQCGWWIDVGTEPLIDALKAAISASDGQRRQMGLRGRELVEQRFSWKKIGAEMRAAYEWLLGKGPKPEAVML